MGIFSRFRDIISANINAMLDRAEDPHKLIRLMIHEMEDTLVELKAACAGVMAEQAKIRREIELLDEKCRDWEAKAALAVRKQREDLAREALIEKRRYLQSGDTRREELAGHEALVEQYREEILQLEEKLNGARDKQRLLAQRHAAASHKKQAQAELRRAESRETVHKFEELENRIERMEAEADLVHPKRTTPLEDALDKLMVDEDIEEELRALKAKQSDPTEERK
ncbi:MAG: phage shock protein PspA [Desulfosarcinaceae bacterium]|nr:phage shock protein PspA [Desulfosarcinaceae bacterium]